MKKEFRTAKEQQNFVIQEGNKAIHNALKKANEQGLPNVFEINKQIIYQMPNGKLSVTWQEKSPQAPLD